MFKNDTHRKKTLIFALALLISLFLAACRSIEVPTGGGLPAGAVLTAQSWLADQLGVAVEEVTIINSEQVEWTDSCLGLGGPAEICAAAITPGWQATFEVNGQQYEVRVDESGTTVRSPEIAQEPPALEEE
jgi:hypothetical protein